MLSAFIPEFAFKCDVMHLVDYAIPHTRIRVFLRGIRRSIAQSVPPVLPPFGRRMLRDVLGNFPNTSRSSLTLRMQVNLNNYEAKVRTLVRQVVIHMGDLVVIALDRAADKVYSQSICLNAAPTLTTHNYYLFILSVADVVNRVPDSRREFFRWFQPTERLTLQGLKPSLILDFPSPDLAIKAAGNAYPVPLIDATAYPLLNAVGHKEDFDFASWPTQTDVGELTPQVIEQFSKCIMAKGRKAQNARLDRVRKLCIVLFWFLFC